MQDKDRIRGGYGCNCQEWPIPRDHVIDFVVAPSTCRDNKGYREGQLRSPGTKLGERIRNLDVNSERAHNGETKPESDIITPPKSDMDHTAMYHDLRYHHASKIAKNKKHLRQLKTKADLHLIKDNAINALNPLNGTVDRFTHAASIPAFLSKVAYESVIGKLKGGSTTLTPLTRVGRPVV